MPSKHNLARAGELARLNSLAEAMSVAAVAADPEVHRVTEETLTRRTTEYRNGTMRTETRRSKTRAERSDGTLGVESLKIAETIETDGTTTAAVQGCRGVAFRSGDGSPHLAVQTQTRAMARSAGGAEIVLELGNQTDQSLAGILPADTDAPLPTLSAAQAGREAGASEILDAAYELTGEIKALRWKAPGSLETVSTSVLNIPQEALWVPGARVYAIGEEAYTPVDCGAEDGFGNTNSCFYNSVSSFNCIEVDKPLALFIKSQVAPLADKLANSRVPRFVLPSTPAEFEVLLCFVAQQKRALGVVRRDARGKARAQMLTPEEGLDPQLAPLGPIWVECCGNHYRLLKPGKGWPSFPN